MSGRYCVVSRRLPLQFGTQAAKKTAYSLSGKFWDISQELERKLLAAPAHLVANRPGESPDAYFALKTGRS